MMAGRRERRRALIRSDALMAILYRNGWDRYSQDPNNGRQNGLAAALKASAKEPASIGLSHHPAYTPPQEVSQYLRQLSVLHAAGILTDDEFSAAKGRLFGS